MRQLQRVLGAGLGVLATLGVAAFSRAESTRTLYERFELSTLDLRFILRRPIEESPVILHLDIDDNSIREIGRWPWPRDKHAQMVRVLTEFGVRCVVSDVEFPHKNQPIVEETRYQANKDAIENQFSRLKNPETSWNDVIAGNFINALRMSPGGDPAPIITEEAALLTAELQGQLEETQRLVSSKIDDFVTDHDRDLRRAIRDSQRFYLPFHFDFPTAADDVIEDHVEALRAVLTANPSASEEDVAMGLGLPRSLFKGSLSLIHKRVFLAPIMDRMEEVLASDLDMAEADLAARLELDAVHLEGNRNQLVKEVIARRLERELLERPGLTGEEARALFRYETRIAETAIAAAWERAQARRTTIERFSRRVDPALYQGVRVGQALEPGIAQFVDATFDSGFVSVLPDAEDGNLRRVPLVALYGDRLFFQIAFTAVCEYLGVDVKQDVEVIPGEAVIIHGARYPEAAGPVDVRIPVDEKCQLLLSWAGSWRSDLRNIFHHVPYRQVTEYWQLKEIIRDNYLGMVRHLTDGRFRQYLEASAFAGTHPEDHAYLLRNLGLSVSAERTELIFGPFAGREAVVEQAFDALMAATAARLEGRLPPSIKKSIETDLATFQTLKEKAANEQQRRAEVARTLTDIAQGRICMLGDVHTGSTDLKPTPLHPVFPGVGLHTNLMNSILQRSFVYRASGLTNAAVLLGVGLVVAVLLSIWSPLVTATITVLSAVGYFLAARYLFDARGLWLDVVGPEMSILLNFAVISAWRQLTEERQKRRIRGAFALYLHPEVISQVEKDPKSLKLGGEKREMTVFFSDVAGFTTISESLAPEALVDLLNEYLTAMSDIIMASGGTVDKYEGDAIMAFWGAPVWQEDHARRACWAALDNLAALYRMREKWMAEGKPSLDARVGLNTGPMVVGNMGSASRFNYTVMGDAVNQGSRFEGANKQYGTHIMVSERTVELAAAHIEVRELDLLRVKGKALPIRVFELMAKKGELDPRAAQAREAYAEGLKLYRARRFGEAVAGFETALGLVPGDGPSDTYLDRCRSYQEAPPPEDWDGVYVMTTK
ncbi:MAG: CHASE2 domain-containing protein [Planctomycetes bacterium]|nr:CHASE2 domain-containing protein [Planctomycetota bacterium]